MRRANVGEGEYKKERERVRGVKSEGGGAVVLSLPPAIIPPSHRRCSSLLCSCSLTYSSTVMLVDHPPTGSSIVDTSSK